MVFPGPSSRRPLSLLVIMVAALLAMTSSAVAQPSRTTGDPPRTGFEQRDGDGWTTHQEELELLAAIAATSERMTYSEIGRTHEGRPVHLAQLGDPAPPPGQAIGRGQSVLVVGSQHGREPAGREASLQLLRDLAFTTDPELTRQLRNTTVLVIPSANPDGSAANTRGNALGIDLNRDHFALTQPETQAVAEVLRDFRPDISIDTHEASGQPEDPSSSYMRVAWQRNLNVHEDVYDLNVEMIDDYLFPGLEEAGFTEYRHYGSPGDGEDGPWFLSQKFGMQHGLGMLTESWVGADPNVRVAIQLQTAHEILRFQRERGTAVSRATETSQRDKAAQGRFQSAPFYLRGADWDPEPPDEEYVLDPTPCGYLLHREHAAVIESQVELFGLRTREVGTEGLYVPMAQPMMTLVPDLLDERGRRNLVEGIALDDCADPGAIDPPAPPPPPTEPAQHAFDFSADDPGGGPAGWSQIWNDSSYTVLDDPRRLRHDVQDRTEGDGRQALVIDGIGTDGVVRGDVEVSALVRGSGDDTLFQLGFDLSGDRPGDANALYVDARRHSASHADNVRIGRHLGGSFSVLGRDPVPFTVLEDTWYRVVLRKEGGLLQAKLWPDGEPEPVDWSTTAWDASFRDGRVGILHFTGGTVVDWAFLGVGVGGESAPRPPDGLLDR